MTRRAKITTWIIIALVLLGGTSFWVWNKYTGRFKIGADAILGCQRAGDISAFFGAPGSNLVKYNLFGQEVSVNQKIITFLDQIQKEVSVANTGYIFDQIDTFNIRPKIWGGGRSLHSWGIAVDINPDRNPYQPGNWGEAQTDIPPKIIEIFKKYGFAWGGDWPGERDPMHFEWYGAEVHGSILDSQTNQKIIDTVALVNNEGAPLNKGEYNWLLEAKTHNITVKARGYEDANFKAELFCFEDRPLDITLTPLAENLPGRISGQVRLADGSPMLMAATIYLDGKIVGASNILGDYLITGVRKGKHTVAAKIMLFPGASRQTLDMVPGEEIKNFNIVIGQP